MKFGYDDSHHRDLSIVVYKVLCDDHISFLTIGLDQTNMSLWISDHGRYNKNVCTIGERLVTTKDYVMIVFFQVNRGV